MNEINWNLTRSEINTTKKDYEMDHFFYSQIEEARNLMDSFFSDGNLDTKSNKVIGIIGERGTGKSSVLGTLKNVIADEYYTMNVIDPSIFNEELNLIELFLSEIYKEVIYNNNFNDTKESEELSREILVELKRLTNMLSKVGSDSDYKMDSPAIETLEVIANMTSFDISLKSIIKNYIKLMDKKNNLKKIKQL